MLIGYCIQQIDKMGCTEDFQTFNAYLAIFVFVYL